MGKISKKERYALIAISIILIPLYPFLWIYNQIKGLFTTHPNDPDNPDYRDQGQEDLNPPKPE